MYVKKKIFNLVSENISSSSTPPNDSSLYLSIAIISASLYGTVGYYGTLIMKAGIPLYNMLFWRFCISALIIIIYLGCLPTVKIKLNANFYKQILISAVFYTISTSFCFHASKELGIGIAMSIFFIFPIFNVILCWFFNNPISKTIIYSILLSSLGLGFISLSENIEFNNIKGVLFSLIAAMSFAAYIFCTKKFITGDNKLSSTLAIFLGNSIIFFILSIKNHYFFIPREIQIWKNIFILSMFSTVFPTFLMLYALVKISSTKVAITSIFEPVCALLMGVIYLSETLSNRQLIGIVAIIIASIMLQKDKSPQNL